MSKALRSILPVCTAFLVILQTVSTSAGQDIEATLIVDADRPTVQVKGRFLNAPVPSSFKPLVFLSDYAGVRLPHDRIKNVKHSGLEWSYEVDLTPLKSPSALAHTSWLTNESGVLRLGDLLPVANWHTKQAAASISIPRPGLDLTTASWVTTSEKRVSDGEDSFTVTDVAKAVFLLSFDPFASIDGSVNATDIALGFSGVFQFEPIEVLDAAGQIDHGYDRMVGARDQSVVIGLVKQPSGFPIGAWEANTSGSTITIVSSDMPFKTQSLQRLHEQLRHEMFHLWIPEGVNLTGNYDWFYEGFALYQSLKLGMAVNRLRFEDYLDSLGQAYAIDRRLGGKLSLIDASKTRWFGDNNSVIYARGMLVAFLCDLAMLEASKGKRSTDDLVREVYQKHSGAAAPTDGNAAVMAIMRQRRELVPIIERYVTGKEKLDWTAFLTSAGVESTDGTLKVIAKPNGRQKKLLDKLGYNNWRKLSSTRK